MKTQVNSVEFVSKLLTVDFEHRVLGYARREFQDLPVYGNCWRSPSPLLVQGRSVGKTMPLLSQAVAMAEAARQGLFWHHGLIGESRYVIGQHLSYVPQGMGKTFWLNRQQILRGNLPQYLHGHRPAFDHIFVPPRTTWMPIVKTVKEVVGVQ